MSRWLSRRTRLQAWSKSASEWVNQVWFQQCCWDSKTRSPCNFSQASYTSNPRTHASYTSNSSNSHIIFILQPRPNHLETHALEFLLFVFIVFIIFIVFLSLEAWDRDVIEPQNKMLKENIRLVGQSCSVKGNMYWCFYLFHNSVYQVLLKSLVSRKTSQASCQLSIHFLDDGLLNLCFV